jgi:signal peptidase I
LALKPEPALSAGEAGRGNLLSFGRIARILPPHRMNVWAAKVSDIDDAVRHFIPNMNFRWFLSKTVREVVAVQKHYARLLAAQRDVLSPQAVGAVTAGLNNLAAALAAGENKGALRLKAEELQFAGEKWLKPYPHAAWRENIEVLLVALAVALAIRTFFLQPFKIPTGSMQPTLFGVTSTPDFTKINFWQDDKTKLQAEVQEQYRASAALEIPTGWAAFKAWLHGESYLHIVAEADGPIESVSPVTKFLIFNIKQTLVIGGHEQTAWFPPDLGEAPLAKRCGLNPDRVYHKGEDVVKLRVSAGDHLFVDRLTFNFRKPERGEIVVFKTQGINHPQMPQDQFYIKRLVVLPHEKVRIGDDRHLVINGERLDASTPHFENVYGFNPATPPKESQFSGHVNNKVAAEFGLYPNLAPLFLDGDQVFDNDGNTYMVMGDNTCNSFDSRAWGTFPAENVIGKQFFVYWPLTSRFGWANR